MLHFNRLARDLAGTQHIALNLVIPPQNGNIATIDWNFIKTGSVAARPGGVFLSGLKRMIPTTVIEKRTITFFNVIDGHNTLKRSEGLDIVIQATWREAEVLNVTVHSFMGDRDNLLNTANDGRIRTQDLTATVTKIRQQFTSGYASQGVTVEMDIEFAYTR